MFFYDPWFWLIIPGIILGIYAQIKLSGVYNKYVRVGLQSGTSGAEAAREILDRVGLDNVPVEAVGGHLTDHYDPIKKALVLSGANLLMMARGRD